MSFDSVAANFTFRPDAVLLSEILDDCILLAGNPSGHRGHEDLPRVVYRRHPRIVARSKTDQQLSDGTVSGLITMERPAPFRSVVDCPGSGSTY